MSLLKSLLPGSMEEERHKLEVQMQQRRNWRVSAFWAGGIALISNNLLTVILGHANLALADLFSGISRPRKFAGN